MKRPHLDSGKSTRRILILFFAATALIRADGYMAQIADGGGWDTTVTVVNTSSFAEQVTVWFWDDGGNALTLNVVGLGPTPGVQFNLPAFGVGVFQTSGDGQSITQGYATVTGRTVAATASFRWRVAGQPDFEVASPSLGLVQRMIFSFNNTNGYVTGIAIVGASLDRAAVIVRDRSGNIIGTHSRSRFDCTLRVHAQRHLSGDSGYPRHDRVRRN
jgi:hypothetical protein